MNKPNRSFASGVPPTVYGNSTAGMPVLLEIHWLGLFLLVGRAQHQACRLPLLLHEQRAQLAVVGSMPGFGSSEPTSLSPSQWDR